MFLNIIVNISASQEPQRTLLMKGKIMLPNSINEIIRVSKSMRAFIPNSLSFSLIP